MTHPSPTAATSASPPPRGEGLGVGGRPRHTTAKPRPDTELGPRQIPFSAAREVPGRGRDSIAPCLAALLLASPLSAQIIPTGSPKADILLTTALNEQRAFLTCSSLDAYSHGFIVDNWTRDSAAAVATLTEHKVPPEAIAAFQMAAKLENLLPAPDTPIEDVIRFCDGFPDWQVTYARLGFTILSLKLPGAFQ